MIASLLKVSPSRLSASTDKISAADLLHSGLKIEKVKKILRGPEALA
jgi:hypothetical protein